MYDWDGRSYIQIQFGGYMLEGSQKQVNKQLTYVNPEAKAIGFSHNTICVILKQPSRV